jgi:hypothetical protein
MSYDKAATRHSFGIFDFGGAADQEFTILGAQGQGWHSGQLRR